MCDGWDKTLFYFSFIFVVRAPETEIAWENLTKYVQLKFTECLNEIRG